MGDDEHSFVWSFLHCFVVAPSIVVLLCMLMHFTPRVVLGIAGQYATMFRSSRRKMHHLNMTFKLSRQRNGFQQS